MKQGMVSRKAGLLTVFFLLFFFTAFNVFALGRKEKNAANNHAGSGGKNTTTLIGRIQVYGNEPHTFVGIVDEHDVAYSIHPPNEEAELWKLQGYLIEFTVIFLDKPQGNAGLILGRTLTLIDWKVLN
ncbi:MAG: hypothetical protein LBB72_04815 [Spirochaetaceae bacterium]|jgi:hypothetical protein|nr:hypothetical protein [Spirochaetaceae bacterium]